MARPRISDDERRSECFTIRVSPAERLALQAEAARLRMSPTELARARVLKGHVVVREHRQPDPRLIFELNKIGVNLNQIARALNSQQNVNPAVIEGTVAALQPVLAGLLLDRRPAGNLADEPAPLRPGTGPQHRPVRDGPRDS